MRTLHSIAQTQARVGTDFAVRMRTDATYFVEHVGVGELTEYQQRLAQQYLRGRVWPPDQRREFYIFDPSHQAQVTYDTAMDLVTSLPPIFRVRVP